MDRDELLREGPREAPDAETAEERSHRLGKRGLAGGAAAGGAAAIKFGGASKVLVWLFAWHGFWNLWRLGAWAVVAALAIATVALVIHWRRENA